MSERRPSDNKPTLGPHRPAYEKPRVVSEEVFETLALSCARANPFACPGGNPDRS
jgi:hypothetical protein